MKKLSFYQWSWVMALTSFILRIPGFFVDLPPYNFVDEAIYTNGIYSIALSDWGWAPYNYLAGGLNYYIPALIIAIVHKFFNHPFSMDEVIVLSRLLGPGILSCLAIPLTFAAGQRIFENDKIALLSSIILAFSPLMLGVSRIWYPDHYAVIFSALSLYAAIRIVKNTYIKLYDYIFLGISIGLSASTKYNGLFFIFLIPIAHSIVSLHAKKWKKKLQILFCNPAPWLAGLAIILTFIAANPYILVDWHPYIHAIRGTREAYLAGSAGLMVANTPVFYTTLLLFTTFGIMGGPIIFYATLSLIRRDVTSAVILILMPVIFVALMSEYKNAFDRNISVLIPYTALILSYGFYTIIESLKLSYKILFFILLAAEPFARICLNVTHDFQPDSRKAAKEWINREIPSGSRIGLGRGVYNGTRGLALDSKKFTLVELPFPPDPDKDPCVEYYFVDSWMYALFGKGSSVFISPWFSENIFRNTGGYYFKKEHLMLDRWLSDFQEIHRTKGFFYGPYIHIYKRKNLCPHFSRNGIKKTDKKPEIKY